jgi:hypothetical protein
MAIRHLISNTVELLTPSRNGRVWIRYQSGRMAEVDTGELIAAGGWEEINRAFNAVAATWKWTDEWETPNWHRQCTSAFATAA